MFAVSLGFWHLPASPPQSGDPSVCAGSWLIGACFPRSVRAFGEPRPVCTSAYMRICGCGAQDAKDFQVRTEQLLIPAFEAEH